MIPGSNLLNMATSVIATQSVAYYRATGRALNNVGQDDTTYAPPVLIRGSFQPVPRRLYQSYGLDFQKTYYTLYAPKNIIDVTRNVSADQIVFNNQRYQCESSNDWFAIDGWVGMLCVLITSPVDNSDEPIFGFGGSTPDANNNQNFDNGGFDS